MKVVILEPVVSKLEELVRSNRPEWDYYDVEPKDRDELVSRLKGAEAVAAHNTYFDESLLKECPSIKYIAAPAIGAEMFVDMEAANRHGVTVMNCPGYNADTVAETAFLLALSVTRMLPETIKGLGGGVWVGSEKRGQLLRGKDVGIVGNGSISKSLQDLLRGWSCRVEYVDSSSSSLQVDDMFSRNDYIFVCCPLNESTRGIVSRDRINSMKSKSVLVNVARGAVIDEDALYEALELRRIAGAGLDVFLNEPQYGDKLPENIDRFLKLDNVMMTPHTAGLSEESGVALGEAIYSNLVSCIEGSPSNIYIA